MEKGEISFEDLVHQHQAGIFRYLRYLGADEHMAADALQESFMAAWSSGEWKKSRSSHLQAAWLRGIARNQFLMICRKKKYWPRHIENNDLEKADAVWEKEFLKDGDGFEATEALRACLEKITGRKKEALDMRYKTGYSRDQMAKSLKMSPNGVKALLQRLRSFLSDCVKKKLELGESYGR